MIQLYKTAELAILTIIIQISWVPDQTVVNKKRRILRRLYHSGVRFSSTTLINQGRSWLNYELP